MKKAIFLLIIGLSSIGACSTSLSETSLEKVYSQISSFDGYETLSQEDITGFMKIESGQCKGTVYPNSNHRDKVLEILSSLPETSLYSEDGEGDEKITRFYIMGDSQDCSMLFAFVGFGGNDLVVLLFEHGDIQEYKRFAASLYR